jgi:hypothetical protein
VSSGQTEHAVHRRADFVAHVGQEFALGLARPLSGGLGRAQFLLAVAQRLLGQRTLCGVEEHRVDADHFAGVVDVGHMAARVPHRVAGAVGALALQRHRLAGQRGAQMRLDAGPQLRADDIAHMLAEHFVFALGQPDFLSMVDVAVVALGVDVRDRDRDLIHDRTHAALGAPRRVERALLLRHIHRQQAQTAGHAGYARIGAKLDLQRLPLAICQLQGAAQARRLAFTGGLQRRDHGRREGDAEGVGDRQADEVLRRHAQGLGQLTAQRNANALRIDHGAQAVDRAALALIGGWRVGGGHGRRQRGARCGASAPENEQHRQRAQRRRPTHGQAGHETRAEVHQQRGAGQQQHHSLHAARSKVSTCVNMHRSNRAMSALASGMGEA